MRPSEQGFFLDEAKWRWICGLVKQHLGTDFDTENVAAQIVMECWQKDCNPGPQLIRWRCWNVVNQRLFIRAGRRENWRRRPVLIPMPLDAFEGMEDTVPGL